MDEIDNFCSFCLEVGWGLLLVLCASLCSGLPCPCPWVILVFYRLLSVGLRSNKHKQLVISIQLIGISEGYHIICSIHSSRAGSGPVLWETLVRNRFFVACCVW